MSYPIRLRFDKLECGLGDAVTIIAEMPPTEEEYVYIDIVSDVAKLEHYKLKRAKEGLDLFLGSILLIGSHREKSGEGPSDGLLPVKRGGLFTGILEYKEQRALFRALVVSILPEIIFDQVEYTPFDELIVSVISPDSNEDPDRIEEITVLIASSSENLGLVKLKETGPSTGIFEDSFYLHPIKGVRNLQAKREDGITVEFRIDSDTVATKSVFVNYHVGQIMFDKEVYSVVERAVIRVIDPDENRDPNAIDSISIQLWSSTDRRGLRVLLSETGDRTGIFEAIIGFTTKGESADNILHVSEEDIITAKYIDKTLPAPARLSDDLIETIEVEELFASASIGLPQPLPKTEVSPSKVVSPIIGYAVVEGRIDEIFLNAILNKAYETSFENLRLDAFQQTKSAQCPFIRSLVTKGKMIIAFRDVDDKSTLQDTLENCKKQINTSPGLQCTIVDNEIRVSNGVIIKIIELGLPDDPDLKEVGIIQATVEDYLLKLLAMDAAVKNWAGVSLRDIREHLEPFKSLKGIELNKSKPFISMLASLKKISYEECVTEIIKNAEKDSVKKLTKDIFERMGS